MEDYLSQAIRTGRMSFSLAVPSNQSVATFFSGNLLTVNVPTEHACAWTVNLNRFQFHGGPVLANLPSENQVDSRSQMRARVTWGVDGANETAEVDYYPRGCTFQVHAANVRVDLVAETTLNLGVAEPILSGFMSPTMRSSVIALQSPTYTPTRLNIAAAATALVPIPARAVAYRVLELIPFLAPGVQFIQEDSFQTLTSFDSVLSGFPGVASTSDSWFPLSPESQFVQAQNNQVSAPAVFVIQFLLDLG